MPALDSAALVGVQTATPSNGGIAAGIECFAELSFNQNKLAQIVAPVGGIVQEVTVDLGSRVTEKETVARLWSATIAEAVARAVLSHQTLEREQRLHEQRVTSQQNLQEAEAAHRAACQQLSTLGFTEEHIDALGETPLESVMLDVRAPFAGEIVERTAVRGALVEAGKPLFTVADRSVMWAMLNIPESALVRVQPGQSIELQFDSIPGRTFSGTLTWVGAEVDHRSRMVQARAEVPNSDGLLRANMFARARILTGRAMGAMVLPASAIQQVEGRPVVFVKLADDLFEARAVRIGTRFNGQLEVLEGIEQQEEVVVAQGFALKSQLLISRLGAGCAHE
jgi:cobalt-zinc-cadmium efflux system membrane fusion protein